MEPCSLAQAALEDPEAFACIVSRHQGMVYSIAYHYFQNRSVAEDLAQDAFLELYRHLQTIESDAHRTRWLRRSTINKCIDHARWSGNHPQITLEAAPEPHAVAPMADPLLTKAIGERMRALPERKRLVVILRF